MNDKNYKKYHDKWSKKAKQIDGIEKENVPFFDEREIWWCSVGSNIGSEMQGKGKDFSRPVLVLRKINADLFIGVPLTSNIRKNRTYTLHAKEYGVALSHVRSFSPKRLLKKEAFMEYKDFHTAKLDLIRRISLSEEDYKKQKKNKRTP